MKNLILLLFLLPIMAAAQIDGNAYKIGRYAGEGVAVITAERVNADTLDFDVFSWSTYTITGFKTMANATGDLGNSTTGMNVIYADTLVMGGLTTIKLKISLADDATYNLPDAANVYCKVWTGANMAHYVITTAGVVAMPVTLNSVDDADTDGVTICMYDGGTYAILKNRSGGTLTFNVCIEY